MFGQARKPLVRIRPGRQCPPISQRSKRHSARSNRASHPRALHHLQMLGWAPTRSSAGQATEFGRCFAPNRGQGPGRTGLRAAWPGCPARSARMRCSAGVSIQRRVGFLGRQPGLRRCRNGPGSELVGPAVAKQLRPRGGGCHGSRPGSPGAQGRQPGPRGIRAEPGAHQQLGPLRARQTGRTHRPGSGEASQSWAAREEIGHPGHPPPGTRPPTGARREAALRPHLAAIRSFPARPAGPPTAA